MGRRLEWPDNYFTLTNSLTFQIYDYKNYLSGTASLPAIGQTNSILFNTTLARNSIDNPMFPLLFRLGPLDLPDDVSDDLDWM